jgi:hypothetical protein
MSSVVYPVQSYTVGGYNTVTDIVFAMQRLPKYTLYHQDRFHLHLTAFGLKSRRNDGLLIQK